MLVDRKSLALHGMTSSDEPSHRYATHCVHVEPDGTAVATNLHAIIAVEPTGLKDDDYPNVGKPAEIPRGGVDIPADAVKEVLRSLPKQPMRPILGAALITEASKERIELTTTDLRRTRRLGFKPDERRFPGWRGMMVDPRKDEVRHVTLALEELENVVKTLKVVCAGYDGIPHVTLHVPTGQGCVALSGKAGEGRRFAGVLADVKIGSGSEVLNDWQERVMSGKPVERIKKRRKPEDAA